MKKQFIIIMGPTGVGKSDLVLSLGKELPIEIINGDIGSFYTPCTIGTAKPDWQHSSTPHHLFDIFDEPQDCTVADYRKIILEKLEEIWQRNKTPVIVGGSGFYLQSLFFPPQEILPQEINQQEIIVAGNLSDNKNNVGSWQDLYNLDPERAHALDKNDQYRIDRALLLIQKTGRKASDFKPVFNPPLGDALIIFLTRDRQELYQRINERVEIMMQQGWIEEVTMLIKNGWAEFLERKKLIGYNDLIDYLKSLKKDDMLFLKKVVEVIQQKSRHYAKRQLTFWRSFNKMLKPFIENNKMIQIHEINLSLNKSDKEYMSVIKNFINQPKRD